MTDVDSDEWCIQMIKSGRQFGRQFGKEAQQGEFFSKMLRKQHPITVMSARWKCPECGRKSPELVSVDGWPLGEQVLAKGKCGHQAAWKAWKAPIE